MQALLKISSTLKPCAIWRNKRWWRKSVFSSAVNLRLSILVKNQRVHLGAILYSQHLFKTLVNDNVWKLIHQSLKSRFKNRFSAGQIKCRHLTMTNTNYGGLANELELKTDFWRTVFLFRGSLVLHGLVSFTWSQSITRRDSQHYYI